MPPKPKITREDILAAAFHLVRGGGLSALNARAIATALNCSTQPIFRFYATMEDLKADVIERIGDYYGQFVGDRLRRGDVPPYKASGLAYIQFAKAEKELFKVLFMRDRTGEPAQESDRSFDAAVEMIMEATGLDRAEASRLHLQMWIFTHGIAALLVTSYLSLPDDIIGELLTDAYSSAIRHRTSGKERGGDDERDRDARSDKGV